jgi:hypothetical protein
MDFMQFLKNFNQRKNIVKVNMRICTIKMKIKTKIKTILNKLMIDKKLVIKRFKEIFMLMKHLIQISNQNKEV